MKKEFKKIGFILVAAVSMFVVSCGGAEEPTTDAPAEPTTEPATEPVAEPVTEPAPADTAAACDAGACEGGACDGAEKPAAH